METKLTEAQRRFLGDMVSSGESRPPYGQGPNAASAWRRTVRALASKGLVTRDLHRPAYLTEAGRAAVACRCLRLDGWGVDGDGNCWTCGKAVSL